MRHSGHFDLESCAVLGVGIGEPGCVCATLLGNRVPRTFTYRTPFFAGKAAVAHCLVFPVVDACTELVSHCTYLSYCKT